MEHERTQPHKGAEAKEIKVNRIWRRVTGYKRYRFYKAHGDTIVIKLECGHEVGRKASQGVPKKAVCRQCELGRPPKEDAGEASPNGEPLSSPQQAEGYPAEGQ